LEPGKPNKKNSTLAEESLTRTEPIKGAFDFWGYCKEALS
jgi:hypothetical protein